MNRSNAAGTGSGVHHWVLRKNCSFTPRQVLYFYLSLTAVSISIALWFTWRGLWLVLPYAVVENLVLAFSGAGAPRARPDNEPGPSADVEVDLAGVDVRVGDLAEADALGYKRTHQLLQRLHVVGQCGEIDVHTRRI